MLCSHPRGYEETLVGRDGASFHSGAASLFILLFHATFSRKVTVNRFPRFSQWAIAPFLLPLIFQCQGIKCVIQRAVPLNACLLHGLLTRRGESHDASGVKKEKKKNLRKPKQRSLFRLVDAASRGGGKVNEEPRGEEMTASCVVDVTAMTGRWAACVCVCVWWRV